MTPLAVLTRDTSTIPLDFDGPVCSIFAGMPDHVAAQRLRSVFAAHGINLPEAIASAHDPLEVLRYTGDRHRQLVAEHAHTEPDGATRRQALPHTHARSFSN